MLIVIDPVVKEPIMIVYIWKHSIERATTKYFGYPSYSIQSDIFLVIIVLKFTNNNIVSVLKNDSNTIPYLDVRLAKSARHFSDFLEIDKKTVPLHKTHTHENNDSLRTIVMYMVGVFCFYFLYEIIIS